MIGDKQLTETVRVYVWEWPVRVSHWLIAGSIAILSVTGLYIANRQRLIAERRFIAVRQLAAKLFEIDTQVAQLPGGEVQVLDSHRAEAL